MSKKKTDFQRPQAAVLAERLAEPRRFVQVVAGPRQVGKSTLVQQVTAELGVPVDEHITRVLKALQDNADILGIRGNSAWVSHKS